MAPLTARHPPPKPNMATLLLLADGRLPTGAHAHSGGVEAAVADGRIGGIAGLGAYLRGRLDTTGAVEAAFAIASRRWAAGSGEPQRADELDAELAARLPSPTLRRASRTQGRGLRRVASRCWPSGPLDTLGAVHADGPLLALVLGAAGAACGLGDEAVAVAARWAVITGPAWAAVRLLGLDPLAVAELLGELARQIDADSEAVAGDSRARLDVPGRGLRSLPASSGPLCELAAEAHATWEVRLFAS